MNDFFNFERLNVYQRAIDFSVKLCKIASGFPYQYSRIRNQLIGAVTSVPLNIAEGTGRKTKKDINNFYRIARSSVFETIPLLEICLQLDLINDSDYRKFRNQCMEFSKIISTLIKRNNTK